jgi:hypothetical protein
MRNQIRFYHKLNKARLFYHLLEREFVEKCPVVWNIIP